MNEFQPKLVLDSRIHDITDKIDVAVESSAAQSTYQTFTSVNNSNSSITFNVNIPSENIAVDRRILMNTEIKFQVKISNVPTDGIAFTWGSTDGVGQFPLNGLFQQVQATINNVSVSVPLDDVMAPLLRMCDQREVSKMNSSLTASYIDQNISNLAYCSLYDSNPLGGFRSVSLDQTVQGRGTINAQIIIKQYDTAGTLVDSNSVISTDPTNYFIVQLGLYITEPFLFLSPFQGLVKSKDEACFLGINNMNIVCNIKSDLTSLYKTSNTDYTHVVSLGWDGENIAFSNPQLLMNFLTLQPEQYASINTRNVLPIQDYPRYVSSDNQGIGAGASTSYTFTFPVIQLNQVPDTLLLFVRPNKSTAYSGNNSLSEYGYNTQSQYYSITKAAISFNNQSGILASCSQEQLFNISKMNGSQQSWSDFVGVLNTRGVTTPEIADGSGYAPSQGSILVLKPAYNFNLPSFLSSGSLGQFGLQIQLTCINTTGTAFTASDMVVIAVNSGIMVTQQGSSSLYSGLLTKNMVLETKQTKPAIDSSTLSALTGGSIQEACHTGLKKVLKKHFGKQPSSGSGMSAGGMSAGKVGNRMSKYT